ncbi:putative phosphatidate phosphatase [Rosa chinensis]|uniref:Putative phosphatidate phosphatase n=2 Tax=Rosa chinensis TaxID=74649 RepID=A0A2P6RMB1_ROSCH|nr:lipid phosphate phosphatase epsilon 2, chloroplastic isoform X1 [Rosa chinensis]PRQ47553.1 putative phosphatidate phosphatase [Rosa chinensis]
MTSSTAISFLQPKLQFFPCPFCSLKSLKPFSSPKFPISKLAFSGGLDPKKAPPLRNRVMGSNNSMLELTNLLPFRNNANGHETVRVLQREECSDGSEDSGPGNADNGLESTLNRLSKWLVSGLFAVVILCRHDAEALWAAMGSVVNSTLSIVLKKILNQDRPIPSVRSEPGMPSSHSQSIFYIFMFAILSFVEWLGINEITIIIGALALAFGAYLSWLRVSQRLHTMSQVVVGAAIGTIFSILWYWSWNAVVHEAFTSFLWVRIVVVLGAAGFCAGFLLYVIRYWIRDDR